MIPIFHQGLHSLALGPRSPVADVADAQSFFALLTEQIGSTDTLTPAVSAEACLTAGMLLPAQPILLPKATGLPLPKPVNTAELPDATSVSKALTADNPAQPKLLPPSKTPDSTAAKPDLLPEWTNAAQPITTIIMPENAEASLPFSHAALPPQSSIVAPATAPALAATPIMARAISAPLVSAANPRPSEQPLSQLRQVIPIAATPADQATTQLKNLPNQTQPALPTPQPVPQTTNISAAESAWQTRLQITRALKPESRPSIAPDPLSAAPALQPNIDGQVTAATTPPLASLSQAKPDHTDHKTSAAPTAFAGPAIIAEAMVNPNPHDQMASIAPPFWPAKAALAVSSSDPLASPTQDANAVSPDQIMPQTTIDPASLPAKPLTLLSITPHQTPQPHGPPLSLAPALPAQLIQHVAAAQIGAVDVWLKPDELGHLKFQIQQHGEQVRITLSAERPETLDLLRRHSDQLLQEFRDSGFSQATLSFGQWAQQQKPTAPPPELTALPGADFADPIVTPKHTAAASAQPSGQGLNLRL